MEILCNGNNFVHCTTLLNFLLSLLSDEEKYNSRQDFIIYDKFDSKFKKKEIQVLCQPKT